APAAEAAPAAPTETETAAAAPEADAAEAEAEAETETAAAAPAEPAPSEEILEVASLAFDFGDPASGEKIFRKCSACHMVGDGAKNRVGPILTGVIGRPAAAVDGFKYSKAMAAKGDEGLVWTPEVLLEYLERPRDYVKGTSMSYAGLRKEDERRDVIAYLNTFE
ncbi:MAG: cytochrome c family protein, partial [Pseudomonadota bacterium]